MSAAGASPESNPIGVDGRWGDELLRINNKFSVPNYPLGVSKNIGSEYHGGVLGLRRNSSLLTRLTSAAVIPSNSYSFWWGLQGAGQPEQMNGNLVLGGIDSAKIGGSNLTRPLSDDGSCASRVIVDITALRVKASDGTKRDLLGKAQLQSIKACVDTTYPIISTPQSVWNAFLAVTGPTPISRALGLDFCGYYSLIGDAYTGDLEITLSDSLTITIPNSQLVIPERDYGDDGRPRITNDKTRGLLINGLDGANTNDIPLLGRAFLTSAYLHVNNEKNEWSMWQAYAVADQKLVSVPGPGDLACPSNTTGSTTTGNNGTSSPAPVNGSTALTTGSIVGLALGSVTFLLLLALAAFLLLRRRRNRINHPKRTTLSDMYPAKLVFETPLSGSRWKSKRRTMTGSVRELSAGGGSVRELSSDGAVVELPQMSSRKVRVNGAPAVYHEVPGAEMPVTELPGHDR